MRESLREVLVVATVMLGVTTPASAGDRLRWRSFSSPATAAPAAAPAPVGDEGIGSVPPASVDFVRPNPYDVWQIYAPNQYGEFRPRVVPSPDGMRYLYDGQPYPWWPEYPRNWAGFISQPANFSPALPSALPPIGARILAEGSQPPPVSGPTGAAPIPIRPAHPLMPRCTD